MPLRRFGFKTRLFSHSCVDLSSTRTRSIDGRVSDVLAVGLNSQVALGRCDVEDEPKASGKKQGRRSRSKEKRSNLKRSASDSHTKSKRVKPPKEKNSSLKRSASDGHTKSMRIKPQAEAKSPKGRKVNLRRSASDGHTKNKRIKPSSGPVPLSVSENGHVRIVKRVQSNGYSHSPLEDTGSSEYEPNPIIGQEAAFVQSTSEANGHAQNSQATFAMSWNGTTTTDGCQKEPNAIALIKVDHAPSRPDSVSNGVVPIEHVELTDSIRRAQLLDKLSRYPLRDPIAYDQLQLPTGATATNSSTTNTLNVGKDLDEQKRHTACLDEGRQVEAPESLKAARRKSSGAEAPRFLGGSGFLRKKPKGDKPDEVHWKRKV